MINVGVESVVVVGIIGLITLLVWSDRAMAHCDTLDGPVVTEARLALERGDVRPLLKWVREEDEEEIRATFNKVLAVRSKGPEARELADMYFFETLVRLHRAGEGEPYTGLKPAGYIEPPIAAADKAISEGNIDHLTKEIAQAAEKGIRARFERLITLKGHKEESVEAGREYVEAYVTFIHYVEELYNIISGDGGHH